ncbi:MAG TPA: transporter substrate-binding domain-containing protein [Acidiferrobacteraceae bacterium]|nr:transporter substrate-binding domain-containing protein [Acidiferrobacteraceae bacterium]
MAYNHTHKFLINFYSLLLIFTFIPFSAYADALLSITSGRNEPFVNPDHSGFYDLIVKNMFQRIGIEAKTVLLPSERSLINANTGVDDGNIARIKGIEKKYSNLIMVPEKVIVFDFVAFARNKQLRVKDWKDLEPYNVTFINGWKIFEKKVKYYKSLVRARDPEQLFGLLNNNRVDIALYDRWSGLWWLKQKPEKKYYLQPPIASFDLYLYINKKHKDLVPGLSRALKAMKTDGTYKQIYDQSLNSLLN